MAARNVGGPEGITGEQTGTRITPGQTLCIIEAMKIMNPLDAEVSGVLREICVEDAQPVEFGQVLFRVDPNA